MAGVMQDCSLQFLGYECLRKHSWLSCETTFAPSVIESEVVGLLMR